MFPVSAARVLSRPSELSSREVSDKLYDRFLWSRNTNTHSHEAKVGQL